MTLYREVQKRSILQNAPASDAERTLDLAESRTRRRPWAQPA